MKIFDSIQEWKRHYRSIRDLIEGEKIRPQHYEPLSKIAFPIIVEDSFDSFGAMAFFTNKVKCYLHDDGNFKFNIGHRKKYFKSSSTDIDLNIISYVETLLSNHYPVSEKFIELEIDPSINSGIAELDLENFPFEIEGGSYNLAFIMKTIIDPVRDALNCNIALTGKLRQKNNGGFIIDPVENMLLKFYAVASYKIDKFFIPRDNIEDIKKYQETEEYYKILKGCSKLEIIPVDTPLDVLTALFGDRWFEFSAFRKVYDLKYMLKQEILASNYVRIKNILGKEKNTYADIDKYVKIQIIEDSKDKKICDSDDISQVSSDAKNNGKENLKNELKPITPSGLLDNFGNSKTGYKIVIIGGAGSGKSTILRKLLFQICNEENVNTKFLLPIFIELKLLNESEKDFIGTLIECFLNHRETEDGFTDFSQRDVFGEYIKALYEAGGVLFLLDAYDEIMIPDQNFKIGSLFNTIITTRYLDKEVKGCTKYEVKPLTSESTRDYIHNYMSDVNKAENLIQLIETNKDSGITPFFENPLMLSLITNIISSTGAILKIEEIKKTLLISKSVDVLLKKIEKHNHFIQEFTGMVPLEFANHFYTEVAKYLFYRTDIKKDLNYVPKNFSIDNILRKFVLESKKNSLGQKIDQIICELMEIFISGTGIIEHFGKDEYRFFHQVFNEYYMAQYLVNNFDNNDAQNFIKKIIIDGKWRDLLLFVAEGLDDADKFFKIFFLTMDDFVNQNNMTRFLSIIEKESHTIKIEKETSELHVKVSVIASIFEVSYEILESGIINPKGYNDGFRHAFDKLFIVNEIFKIGIACGLNWDPKDSFPIKFDQDFKKLFRIDRNFPNRINLDRVFHKACLNAVKNNSELCIKYFKKTINITEKLGYKELFYYLHNLKIPPQDHGYTSEWIKFGNVLATCFINYRLIKDYYYLIENEDHIKKYLSFITILLDCLKIGKVSDPKNIKSRLFHSSHPKIEIYDDPTGNVLNYNLPYLYLNKSQN